MISKALQTYAEDLGFKTDNNCIYGVYKNYMITISEKGVRRNIFVNYYLMDSENDALKKFRLSERIKNDINDYEIKEFDIDDNGLSIVFLDTISKLAEYLEKLIDNLIEEEIQGVDTCSECGKTNSEESFRTISFNQNRYTLCDACTINLMQNSNSLSEQQKEVDTSGSLGLGILGSVIALILGSALWNYLASLGIVTMWMGFALALLVYLGYTLLKGKKGISQTATIVTTSIIGVLFNTYTSEIIKALKLAEVTFEKFMLVPMSYIEVAMQGETFDYFTTVVIALLCAALAIIIFATDLLKDKPKANVIKVD